MDGASVARLTAAVAVGALLACGKLIITADGLVNERALMEIEARAKIRRVNAENGSKNSSRLREKFENENKISKFSERTADPNRSYARAHQNQ